jgi:hypothetical protein
MIVGGPSDPIDGQKEPRSEAIAASTATPPTTTRRYIMWRFITRHWRGEISFVRSFWVVFMLGSGVLAIVKSALVEAFNQGEIPEALVWLFEGVCIPVFVWQVTGTWRSGRSALNRSPRSADIQRCYNRLAIVFAASALAVGVGATATIILPIREGDPIVATAVGTAFGLGMTTLMALAGWGVIRVVGKVIATGRED